MKKLLILAASLAAIVVCFIIMSKHLFQLRDERDVYRHNTVVLMQDVKAYRTKDSLNAVRLESLNLKLKEFKKYRADDAELIKSLRLRNRDLQSVVSAQSRTIIEMGSPVRDTVLVSDSSRTHAKAITYRSKWIDLDGIIDTSDMFKCRITSRDSLLVVSSVKYKRFLGFLWKTRKIEDRQVDIVSKNPCTQIIGSEFIEIER